MIRIYKYFSSDGCNQFGERMSIGKNYHCPGIIKYNQNGYHMVYY